MCFPLVVVVLCLSLFCCTLLYVHSSIAIILMGNRELVALLLLTYGCLNTVNVLCDFSSWCRGLVCGVCLWHFLIIRTYFLAIILWKIAYCILTTVQEEGYQASK